MSTTMISMETMEVSSAGTHRNYDVFLSFRGTDTRKTFTDHLYTGLVQAGYHTFRDDDEIERGNTIDSELRDAIKQSRTSIIIFSKDYASSRWCLSELSKIVDFKKNSKHEIVPVFYYVTPSEVGKQTGSYGEAFDRHEKRFSNDENEKNTVRKWREALEEVAEIAGMELKNEADGHESKFVQKIIKLVGNKLKHAVLSVVPFPIGTDSEVRGISSWINTPTDDILAICGIDGIGKTTIAKIVFNKNIEKFEGGSFLADIGQILDGPSGLIYMQKKLLSDIAQGEVAEIESIDKGLSMIKGVMSQKKILLVLDDVSSLSQLYALVGGGDCLFAGSKIIMTTTNERFRENRNIKMHKIEKLQDDDSLRLFCLRAFKKDHPPEGYQEHASEVARKCQGVPLALEILGSSFYGNTLVEWKNKMRQLNDIRNILRVSFESLYESHDKHLFLDIALFFIGKDKDHSVRGLEDCGFFPVRGIENLKDKCLVKIDQDNKLVMHRLVKDMGKEIIREESSEELSQMWPHKDALILLRKYILIFFGIICAFLFVMVISQLGPDFEGNYICPMFDKDGDSWKCRLRVALSHDSFKPGLGQSNEIYLGPISTSNAPPIDDRDGFSI